MSDIYFLEYEGEQYELKYSFKIIRRLRAEGINVPAIHRAILADQNCTSDYADDFVAIAAILLRDAGAKVDEQSLWESCHSDKDALLACLMLFYWVVGCHYAQPSGVKKSLKKI